MMNSIVRRGGILATVFTTIVLGACASGNYYYSPTPLPAGQLSSRPYYYPSTRNAYERGGYAEDVLPYAYPSGGSYLYYSTREYYLPYYYPYYPRRHYGAIHSYRPYDRYHNYRGYYSDRRYRPHRIYRGTGGIHGSYHSDRRRLDGQRRAAGDHRIGNQQRINGRFRGRDDRHLGRVYRPGTEQRSGRVYYLHGQPRAHGRQNTHAGQRQRVGRPQGSGHYQYRGHRTPRGYQLRGDGQGRGQQGQRDRR